MGADTMPLTTVRLLVVIGAFAGVLVACNRTPETESKTETAEAPHDSARSHKENTVVLTEAAHRTARIETQLVGSMAMSGDAELLEVPGQVEIDPRRIALVSSRVAGRLERLNVVEGDRVEAGEIVGSLFSREVLSAQTDLLQAERRIKALLNTVDEGGARALADAARRRLRLLGADSADVAAITTSTDPVGALPLRSPIAGSVVEAHQLPGAAVEPGAPIFTIADLSVVDVVAEIPERALAEVRTGQRASISIAAFPSLRFDGHVERLRDALNPETRTLRAVIHAINSTRRLRPGMFATVRLQVATRDAVARQGNQTVLTIPESAVITDGERRFVFVETGPRTYERREVRVSALTPAATQRALVAVQDGLRAGELVVVTGAFTLKSELAKASLSDEH